jgi:hypothetical protein
MTIRLHLGGSKHGQLLDVPSRKDVVEYPVPAPAEPIQYTPELVDPLNVRYTTEMYRQELIGLFGRRLYVMVITTGHKPPIELLAFDLLASSLAKVLMEK